MWTGSILWDYQQCVFFGGGGAIKEAHYLKKTMSSLTPQLINTSSYEHTHNIHYMKGRASKQSNFWISEFYHLEAVSLSNTLVVGTVFRTYWTFVLSQTNKQTRELERPTTTIQRWKNPSFYAYPMIYLETCHWWHLVWFPLLWVNCSYVMS
jgi:hypothetical protein